VRYLLVAILLSISSAANAGKLWNLFFPPDDLYQRLCVIEIDRVDVIKEYQCSTTHKYPGRYIVSLYVKGEAKPHITYEVTPDIKLIATQNSKKVELPIGVNLGWLFEGKNGKGMMLFTYEVTKDIENNTDTKFTFVVQGIDSELPSEFGQVYLAVEKTMDK
jgi:hypothetical protein